MGNGYEQTEIQRHKNMLGLTHFKKNENDNYT